MEFNEKLQELRKSKGLTQEELAGKLYVSRTAVSKWESGRGYPSIDSLKDISHFFNISIDDLLSGEKLIFIAEKERNESLRNLFGFIFGLADMLSVLFIIFPLYSYTVDGYVYSVNLFSHTDILPLFRVIYVILYSSLIAAGIVRIIFTKTKTGKADKLLTAFSISVNIVTVIFSGITREAYAVVTVFLQLLIKGIIILRQEKTETTWLRTYSKSGN